MTATAPDAALLVFRNTMHITDGHLDAFREALADAVDFAHRHGPQLMVETFVDEDRMLAHSLQIYRDSDAVRLHWKLADPYIRAVMEHCRVDRFEVFGEPDADVREGLRSGLGDQAPPTYSRRVAGFLRFGG
ncbi:hypothetical protein [Streptomyces cavernicola]|uniref:ABM domain-containing protein n=1 Tax=Streptomyces cavernicola TaxID=3043613 RepID=A0ABT6SDQ9_9ACTN|nr:hypothetical protein [Streptomyces sp. B-S-A6]MDI3405802.1 hypothetical protein [Streptomyces sp. B-S-A6]